MRSDLLPFGALEKEFLRMAFNSIKERKLRSSLTVLGIVIGIAAIVSLVSVGEGMRLTVTEVLEQFGPNKILILPQMQMGFGPSAIGEPLKEKDLNDIRRIRGVSIAVPILYRTMPVEYKGEMQTLSVSGVDTKESRLFFLDIQAFDLEKGRFFRAGDKQVAVIGHSVVYDIFAEDVKLRDKLKIKDVSVDVIGMLKEIGNRQDDTMVIIPLDTLREITGEKDEITMILAKVDDASKVDAIAEEIQSKLDNTHGEKTFMVMTTAQITERVGQVTSTISLVLGGIAAISLAVAGIGIANTMLMSVMERTREIGTMKAIGATNADVMKIFLIESALIGLFGGVIGCLVGVGMAKAIRAVSIYYGIRIQTAVTPQLLLFSFGFSVLVGIVFGLWPARRAAKLSPIEALRYE